MIVALAAWLQAVPVALADGPSLNTIISGFAAVVMLFILRAVIDSRDKVRAIWTALHGEAGASVKSGLVHETSVLGKEIAIFRENFRDHISGESLWQETLTKATTAAANRTQATLTHIDTRLSVVEEHCIPKASRRQK